MTTIKTTRPMYVQKASGGVRACQKAQTYMEEVRTKEPPELGGFLLL